VLIQFRPPAVCRVANQQPRLPRATSSLALNACRDGASTASLGSLFQCVTMLPQTSYSCVCVCVYIYSLIIADGLLCSNVCAPVHCVPCRCVLVCTCTVFLASAQRFLTISYPSKTDCFSWFSGRSSDIHFNQ